MGKPTMLGGIAMDRTLAAPPHKTVDLPAVSALQHTDAQGGQICRRGSTRSSDQGLSHGDGQAAQHAPSFLGIMLRLRFSVWECGRAHHAPLLWIPR